MTMRLKPVPPAPESLATVGEMQDALPLVPGSEDDCCARLMRRTALDARDDARTWITFLRALELADEHDGGYARRRVDPDPDALADAFERRVFGARELLDALDAAGEPLSPVAAFERIEEIVPRWERDKRRTWREDWHDRVRRLLDWAVLLELAEETPDGYRAVEDEGIGDGEPGGAER